VYILPFKKVHVKIISTMFDWKYRSYDHFSMPTYFPPTLYITDMYNIYFNMFYILILFICYIHVF
jgi:hypothetical protein